MSPGPESKYLGSLDNLSHANGRNDCECETHTSKLVKQSRSWASIDSGLYDGTLKSVGSKRTPEMFLPSWRKPSPEPERSRSTSPHWQSFTEAAFGGHGTEGKETTYEEKHIPPSVRHPSRSRNLSCESAGRENRMVQQNAGSQANTHVDRLARSGSAASLAVVMASTFPNGGDANFDLEGTAAKISQVCKSLSNSQSDVSTSVTTGLNLTRSRSMNAGMNANHSPDTKKTSRPIFFDRSRSSSGASGIRLRTTPEKRMSQPVRAVRPSPSYREVKEIEEKLKGAASISYLDLITCPRNRLPKHINKLRLQDYLTDPEFVDVFKMTREEFGKMAKWRQDGLKKEVLLF